MKCVSLMVKYQTPNLRDVGSTPTGRVISVKNLHFHWKFNIGNYEKLFRMKWLLFVL